MLKGHDAGTSDDSGRASEVRPTGLPHGHRESSHDHLSDASSRCSSGRGYIVSYFPFAQPIFSTDQQYFSDFVMIL